MVIDLHTNGLADVGRRRRLAKEAVDCARPKQLPILELGLNSFRSAQCVAMAGLGKGNVLGSHPAGRPSLCSPTDLKAGLHHGTEWEVLCQAYPDDATSP